MELILNAFSRMAATDQGIVTEDQVVGLPRWGTSDRYDVEAKTDAKAAAAMQGLPLQVLFRLHQPMLRDMLADRFKFVAHFEQRERPVYELVLAKGGPKLSESSADQHSALTTSSGKYEARHYSIDLLAFNLSNQVGRLVINKTGLTGSYNFTLTWTPDQKQQTTDSGPSIFTALVEQLGLKLVPAKGPVDVLLIDHVERPTEN